MLTIEQAQAEHDCCQAATADWRLKVQKINQEIASHRSTISASTTAREKALLDASLGSDEARQSIAVVEADAAEANRVMVLLNDGRVLAEAKLTEATKAEAKALDALNLAKAQPLVDRQIVLAGKIDEAFAVIAAAIPEMEALAAQLHGMHPNGPNGSNLRGRFRQAVPWVLVKYLDRTHDLENSLGRFPAAFAETEADTWTNPQNRWQAPRIDPRYDPRNAWGR